jgi:ABC-type glycerol-3-phosphate transport system substrate-binding protein
MAGDGIMIGRVMKAFILVLLIGGTLLQGCTSNVEDSLKKQAADGTGQVDKQDVTGNEKKIRLRYIRLGDLKIELQKEFIRSYPDIEITYEVVEYAELDKKILMAHGANDDYDVIQTNHSSVHQFAASNILEPLDDYISNSGMDFSTYQQEAVKIGQIGGHQYAIPYEPDCRIFAYNKKILRDVGVEPPRTMSEMLKVAKAVSQKGYDAMAGAYSKPWFPLYDIGCWMLGNGGHIYVLQEGQYKATLDTPEVIGYVQWAKEMYQYMNKDVNMDDHKVRSLFVQGKVAMYWWGPWEYDYTLARMNPGDVGFSTIPTGKVKSGSSMGGWMFGIGSGSKEKEAAWKFLQFLMEPDHLAKVCSALPVDTRAHKFAPFNDKKFDLFREQLKTAEYPAPPTAVYPETAEVFNRYFNEAMIGKLSPEEACKKANDEVQKYLDTLNK